MNKEEEKLFCLDEYHNKHISMIKKNLLLECICYVCMYAYREKSKCR